MKTRYIKIAAIACIAGALGAYLGGVARWIVFQEYAYSAEILPDYEKENAELKIEKEQIRYDKIENENIYAIRYSALRDICKPYICAGCK